MPTGIYLHKCSTAFELFEKHVDRSSDCWNWNGAIMKGGYGQVKVGGRKGKLIYAHRLSYELHIGKIPEGKEIDHLCRNRRCVNPKHLEAVTRRENTLRGNGPKMLGELNSNKTHCKHGHEFNEENTRYRPSGGRSCRQCVRDRRKAQD